MKYCVQILQKASRFCQALFLPYFPAILIPIMLKSITADLGVCGAG